MMMQCSKAALVTGAARRVGRALALRLAAEGFGVGLHTSARSRGDAEEVAAMIRANGGGATVVEADLADAAAVARIIPDAVGVLGPLSLLVNSASLFGEDAAQTMTPAVFDAHMAINLRAPCLLAQAFAAQIPEGGGSVVNIIDQRVWRLNPLYFSYTLSKAALWAATQTLAQSLAPHIRVNAIGPGPALANARQDAEAFAREVARLPLRRSAALEELADALVYLANARAVTGQMIAVDAGQHLAWETPDVTGG